MIIGKEIGDGNKSLWVIFVECPSAFDLDGPWRNSDYFRYMIGNLFLCIPAREHHRLSQVNRLTTARRAVGKSRIGRIRSSNQRSKFNFTWWDAELFRRYLYKSRVAPLPIFHYIGRNLNDPARPYAYSGLVQSGPSPLGSQSISSAFAPKTRFIAFPYFVVRFLSGSATWHSSYDLEETLPMAGTFHRFTYRVFIFVK